MLNLWGNKTLKNLPKIQADRILAGFTNIETIGEGLKCKELDLSANKVLKILPKMEAERIFANNTNIQSIEDGLKCGYLNLYANKMLKKFPRNFEVGELNLKGTYFSETHTEAEIRKKIKAKNGTVGKIWI